MVIVRAAVWKSVSERRREEENESDDDNEHAVDSGGLDAPTAATSVCAVCCSVL